MVEKFQFSSKKDLVLVQFEFNSPQNTVPIGALGAETNQGTSSAPVTPPQPDPQGQVEGPLMVPTKPPGVGRKGTSMSRC